MDLERDFKPFLIFGIVFSLCLVMVTLGSIELAGVWMDAMYPIFILFSTASFAIAWIRWKKINEKS